MNGERLAELKWKKPTTITSSTTPILIAVMIILAREESLVPCANSQVIRPTMSTAPSRH